MIHRGRGDGNRQHCRHARTRLQNNLGSEEIRVFLAGRESIWARNDGDWRGQQSINNNLGFVNVGWVKLSLRSLIDWMEKPTMPPPSETPKITLYRILGRIPTHVSRKNHFGRRGSAWKGA